MFLTKPLFQIERPALVKRQKPEQVNWKTLKPGSDDWIRFWKKHPELQEEMLEFKKGENHV